MRIYLSGPITSDPDYMEKFTVTGNIVKAALPDEEPTIMNPAKMFPPGMRPRDYIALSVQAVLCADLVVLLPDWELSRGANIEKRVAEYCGIPCLPFWVLQKMMEKANDGGDV